MTQTQQHCSTPKHLLTFLRGQLSSQEESELQLHLNDCVSCRERLEFAAADTNAWNEAKQFFGNGGLHGLTDDSTGDHEEATQGSQRIRQVLDALGPTDDPESLGRIGGYEVTGVVGAGGMGVVLKAHDRSLDRIVAIKVMSPHLASSGSARKRFAREAKAAAAVLHPNVIAIHSVASEDANPYLVMPYVRGASLQKRIDSQGPLPLKDTLRIGAQIAAGLAAAHEQGLVHRDIKPANILLEEGVERVTITDFGLARAVDDASMTCSGVIAGTPQYMSPEQTRGEPIDARSDLFSLGSVMYAMCAGRSPFRAETTYGVLHRIANDNPTPVSEVNSDVPVWLGHIIERLMTKRPEDRFESAAQVAELLEGCLAHVQQPAAMPLPEAVAALAPKKTRRPPIGKFIATAAGAFALLFAGILIVLELDKGTLTIESETADVPIRIMRGETVAKTLRLTKGENSIQIASGTYVIEIDGQFHGIEVKDGHVTLGRRGEAVVGVIQNVDEHHGHLSQPRPERTSDALVSIALSGTTKDGASISASGMGWRVDEAGHILVPSHLVPDCEDGAIELRYADGAIHSATRWKTLGHLALLKSERIVAGPTISLDAVVSLSSGEAVSAILNGTDSVSGSIKYPRVNIAFSELDGVRIDPELRFQNVMTTDFVADDTTLSGAPLLTRNGDVAGMLIRLGATQLIAIPVAEIRAVLKQLQNEINRDVDGLQVDDGEPGELSPAKQALSDLEAEYNQLASAFHQASEDAADEVELNRVYEEMDPRHIMPSKYLAMEEKYRGTDEGLKALVQVCSMARSVAGANSPAGKGRREAVKRVIEHYLQREGLESIIASLGGGPFVPQADELLQALVERSPFRKTQAEALIAQISFGKETLIVESQMPKVRAAVQDRMKEAPPALRDEFEERLKSLENTDFNQLRRDLNEKLGRLAKLYSDVTVDHYGTGGTAAQRLSHAINKIIIGQPAPELEAFDIDGKPFRLSEIRDKHVVLMFAQSIGDDYGDMYAPMRQLVAKYKQAPVRVVGIMSNADQTHLHAAAKRGDLNWIVIPQQLNGPLQLDWGIEGYPAVYIVDADGTLHPPVHMPHYGEGGYDTQEVSDALDELLKEHHK